MKTFLFLLLFCSPFLSASQNLLLNHPSPYLRMHAQDATHWQLWNADVLQRAKKENKLIFVSVGYYSCHWCHVMRRESFVRQDIADILNKQFISIKVDRELNPALDSYLVDFVERSRGHAGWPLNVVLTPEGLPLLGFVYLPADDFKKVMHDLQQRWQENPKKFRQLALQDFNQQKNKSIKKIAVPSAKKMRAELFEVTILYSDEFMGGIGGQAKFPRPALMQSLLDIYAQQPDADMEKFLRTSLDNMANKGLHDVIGGGFFRYTTDPAWQVPHYEKMLYTNASMVQVYLKAYQVFKQQTYLDVANETLKFILNEMALPNGGYISALSAADSHDKEGGSYIWTDAELQKYLSASQLKEIHNDWLFFQVNDELGLLPAALAVDKKWRPIKRALLKKRQQNPSQRDDKLLPSWNAWLLSSLALMQRQSPQKKYQQAGQKLYSLLLHKLKNSLARKVGASESRYLEDYVFVVQALLDWEQAMKMSPDNQTLYKKTLNEALDLFLDADGWRLADQFFIPSPTAPLTLSDAQLPAADVVMYRLIRRLHLKTNNKIKTVSQQVNAKLLETPMSFASRISDEFQKSTAGLPKLLNGAK